MLFQTFFCSQHHLLCHSNSILMLFLHLNDQAFLYYSDAAHKIFFNTTADLSRLPQDMQNMLKYINDGTASDEATKTLEAEVNEARLKEEWKEEYMLTYTIYDELRAEGRAEGRKEGLAEGLASMQKEVDELNAQIADKDKIIASLMEKIKQHED